MSESGDVKRQSTSLDGTLNDIPLTDLRLKPSDIHSWKANSGDVNTRKPTETEPAHWDQDDDKHVPKEAAAPNVKPHMPPPIVTNNDGTFKPPQNVPGDYHEHNPKLPKAKMVEESKYNNDWNEEEYTPEFPEVPAIDEAKYDSPPSPKYHGKENEAQTSGSMHESNMPLAVMHTAKEMKMSDERNEQNTNYSKRTQRTKYGLQQAGGSARKEGGLVSPTASNTSINSVSSGTHLLMQPHRKNKVLPADESIYQRSYDRNLQRKKSIIFGEPDENTDGAGCCGWLLYIFSVLLIIVTLPFSLIFCIKVVQEYERAVIFRLGRLPSGGAKGPGIFFIIPCIESYTKIDLRTVSFDVPPQEVLTKDSVTVSVDAVVYYRVSNPTVSVANVENAHHSTRLLAQTTLRNILGTKNMSEILSDRESISQGMQSTLDEATDRWGIKVERVEIKDVRLPVQLQRAMAAEAEAAREARAKVIAAEGEQKASRALKEAADVMAHSSAALQLRYLQTLSSISSEKNSTIVFPLPIDIMKTFMEKK